MSIDEKRREIGINIQSLWPGMTLMISNKSLENAGKAVLLLFDASSSSQLQVSDLKLTALLDV